MLHVKPATVHARLAFLLPPPPHPPPSSSPFRLNDQKWRVVSTKFSVHNNGYRSDISRNFRCCASSAESETSDSPRNDSTGVFPPWFSVAPMMDWTDNHYRTLARLISKHAWLYTEMVVAETIVHQQDNLDRFLAFSPKQHPIVLQIGGSNLKNLAKATQLANTYNYDEINLNCGCPSGKVAGHGCFGARLMFDPKGKFVGEAMSVIALNCDVPVSVKCRIGVDNCDSYNELCEFVDVVASNSPTKHFIVHARKALLNGLSPADNRRVPPLKYEYYYALLRDFPDIKFTINGGITSIDQVNAARRHGADAVMVGRAAYNPWSTLGHVDTKIYDAQSTCFSRRQVLQQFQIYGDSLLLENDEKRKPNIRQLVKPLLNLFHSEPGNGLWKRKADTALRKCKTIESFLKETLPAIPDHVLDSTIPKAPDSSSYPDDFSDVLKSLPPPYTNSKQKIISCLI